MTRIGLCNKGEENTCIKKDTCLRYIQEYGEPMNIIAVCNAENNYEKYWQVEQAVQTTETEQKENI